MAKYKNFLLILFFFFCCFPMINAQQPAYFSGKVQNHKGKLIKNTKIEVLTKNASWVEVGDGNFRFEFAKDGMATAVTIAYQAKGYKTLVQYYEIAPGALMEQIIVLTKGKNTEVQLEELNILRYMNGILPR